ncbi:probable ATP-dependent RNA helicase kurz [Uranotaenia lowii]|uniref:probable ATP-dependent RNA helicase kurz n=1 Tax=Uranotaenia lowii TaxID=190385 RepID=UPI002479BB4B|nr:probable ATP-dependent RNA helicase kurz [Uranotaenia lowii]
MGKRRFNEKGRQKVETIIDNSSTKQIKLDFETADDYCKGTDDANLLVLPSQKRPTKVKRDKTTVTKILSKKQRKRLEKIVDQKRKKEQRSSLLSALAEVQATPDELNNFTKLSSVQTKGLKQLFKEQKFGKIIIEKKIEQNDLDSGRLKLKSLVGMRKQRLALLRAQNISTENENDKSKNLNIIGIEEESFESESEVDSTNDREAFEEVENSDTDISQEKEKPEEKVTGCLEFKQNLSSVKIENPSQQNVARNTTISVERKTATYVYVERDPEMQAARLKLPILAEEQIIMETISDNSIIILAGETGSGKTTQVPQFLYEAGYALPERGIIAITEPRRVAAISMSKRVAEEMNLSTNIVSYLIRFEGNVTEKTRIKFVTDGVLLKEVESDFLLSAYSVIILDEAHERSIYTDILVGLLSRIVRLRLKKGNPLKLIIMSATLRVKDFTENKTLFNSVPPVINVESRQFPVTVHFNKTTPEDYVREAYTKAVKIHTKLPEGGILIFLTGQKEVNYIVKRLRKAFPFSGNVVTNSNEKTVKANIDSDDEDQQLERAVNPKKAAKLVKKKIVKQSEPLMKLPAIDLDKYQMPWDDAEADQVENEHDEMSDDEMESDLDSDFEEALSTSVLNRSQPLHVLPLYSILPSENQEKVFQPPPNGTRLCVVATNVAETSLTIPGIKYVIDCGRQKTKLYDKVTGVTAFVVTYISKASANQRAGRAGRVGPGHCYRLYSSAVYNNDFIDFAVPEIQKKPVDDLMLQMKCMGIDKVVNFPFPSPPDRTQLETAEKRLILLDALQENVINDGGKSQTICRITDLGKTIAAFPVAPRFGKILALSQQHNLLPYAICLVAALSVQEVFQEVSLSEDTAEHKHWRTKRKSWAGHGHSLLLGDPMILMRAVGAAEFANSKGTIAEFCNENGIRLKALKEIRKLRVQLTNEVNANMKNLNLSVDPKMIPPSDEQAKLLRQLILIGMADQVARKIPSDEVKTKTDKIKYKHAYLLPNMETPVFVHSSSVLKKRDPEWICYQEAFEVVQDGNAKMFLRGITAIEPEWLLQLVPKQCNVLSVLDDPEPSYNKVDDSIKCYVKATIGKAGWELPITEVEMPRDMRRCQYLLKFLLLGKVYTQLNKFRKILLITPDSVLKQYSSSIPRINSLLNLLYQNQIYDRRRLTELWKTNPDFLLDEYKQILPVSSHKDVQKLWPPQD